MIARVETGEVSLTTRIGNVMKRVLHGVIAGNAPVGQLAAESELIERRQPRRAGQSQPSFFVKAAGQFDLHATLPLARPPRQPREVFFAHVESHAHRQQFPAESSFRQAQGPSRTAPPTHRIPFLLNLLTLAFLCASFLTAARAQTAPPVVEAITLADDHPQRSLVKSIGVTYLAPVTAPVRAADLVLHNITHDLDIPAESQAVSYDDATRTARFTFPGIFGGALPQGNYLARVRAPFDPATVLTCGTASPLPPDQVFSFHVRFGDMDGDRDVDFRDTSFLWTSWDLATPAPAFEDALDFNFDGKVDAADSAIFTWNYFTVFPPEPALHAELLNDTGFSPRDGITADPTITGTLLEPASVAKLQGRFTSGIAAFTDLTGVLEEDGSFIIPTALLSTVYGGTLPYAELTLQLQTLDVAGTVMDSTEAGFKFHAFNNCPPYFVSIPVLAARVSSGERTGRIFLCHDEWLLSDTGFAQSPENSARFVDNLTQWFLEQSGKRTGSFHALSSDFSLNQARLAETMIGLGHTWTTGALQPDIGALARYDGIFLVGRIPWSIEDAGTALLLTNYVRQGGNLYVAAGTATHASEVEAWNAALSPFGLGFAVEYNGTPQEVYPIDSVHPVLSGVTGLYHLLGNSIIDLNPDDPAGQILVESNGSGFYAAYDAHQQQAVPVDLRKWSVIQYQFPEQDDAQWELSADGTTMTQRFNADASILVSDFDLVNSSIEGTWRADTESDDDFMGFVFGYQDQGHFYLFDWKKEDQQDRGTFAERGMTVKVVNSSTLPTNTDLWSSSGTSNVKILYHNTIPYEFRTDYRFFLDYQPGRFVIVVTRVGSNQELARIEIEDDTYLNGRFGFYNYSMGEIVYRGFSRQNVPEQTYAYQARAVDPDGDRLTYSIVKGAPGLIINADTGMLAWAPGLTQAGEHDITIAVSDGRGGRDEQSFAINVVDIDKPPQVFLSTTNMVISPGESTILRVFAADDVQVAFLALAVNDQPQALDANGETTFTGTEIGYVKAVATATDSAGQSSTTALQFRVRDPDELIPPAPGGPSGPDDPGGPGGPPTGDPNDVPYVKITSPEPQAAVSYLTPIVGTITSPSNTLHSWRVEYAPADHVDIYNIGASGTDWKIIGSGTQPVTEGVLATFDPTLLPNDPYVIRVVAWNTNGRGWAEPLPITVTGEAKLGNFRLDFTDLQVPLAGIPITVTRSYDTLEAGRVGDFGYGWKLGLQDGDIRETTPNVGGLFDSNPYKVGTRVYLTTPEGKRVGFTFEPEPARGLFLFGTEYRAVFKPDPGVYETLALPYDGGFTITRTGEAVTLFIPFGWNPDDFILTMKDGTRYHYSQTGGLSKAEDLNGNTVTFSHDGARHSSGVSVAFIRDAQGRITEIRDPEGKTITYTYDAAGDLRTVTDRAALTTAFDYRATPAHYLEKVTDPLGRQAVRTEYGPDGRIVAVIDALGNRTEQNFDPANFTGTRIDARGHVTTLVYNDRGNLLEERDPEGGVTKYEYSDPANPDKETAITDPLGRRTTFAYDARGNLTRQTDPNGKTTTVTYTALDKPATVTNSLGQTVRLHYDAAGNLDEVTDHAGNTRQMTRDTQGRVTAIMDAEGNVTRFDYTDGCPCGRPGKVINPDGTFRLYEYNGFGQVTKETDETGVVTLSSYDNEGKLLSTQDAQGRRTTYTYRGSLQETVTNPLGHVTRTEYDDADRQIKITDAEGGIVEFKYDADGNRTEVKDPVGNVTTFVYDKLGRLTEEINALGHKRVHAYDTAGNRTQTIDRNGRRRTFEFDALNRLTAEKWWDNTGAVIRTLEYAFNDLGLQTRAADPAARYDYTYDALNRLQSVKSTVPGLPDFTLSYTYDKNGQVTSVTDNYGVSVGSGYDARSRLATRTWQGPGIDPVRVDFAYDGAGRRTRLDRFIDLAGTQRVGHTDNAWNALGLLNSITHKGPTENTLSSHLYTYDAANRIVQWVIDGQNSTYTYDKTSQLLTATYAAQPNESYTYDKNGNRINPGYTTGPDNQLLADGIHTYTYDPEGNMATRTHNTTGVVTAYEWDHRNRLVKVTDRNGAAVTQTVEFGYDAMDRRLIESVDANSVHFVHNRYETWMERGMSGTVISRTLPGSRLDEVVANKRGSDGAVWLLEDHLGTIRAAADSGFQNADQWLTGSFGNMLANQAPVAHRQMFTGRDYVEMLDSYYYRSRYYKPDIGRFASNDSAGFVAGDANLSRYVFNNPISYADPFGHVAMLSYIFTIETKANRYAMATIGFFHGVGMAGLFVAANVLEDSSGEDFFQRALDRAAEQLSEIACMGRQAGTLASGLPGGVGGLTSAYFSGASPLRFKNFRIRNVNLNHTHISNTASLLCLGGAFNPFSSLNVGGFRRGAAVGIWYLGGDLDFF